MNQRSTAMTEQDDDYLKKAYENYLNQAIMNHGEKDKGLLYREDLTAYLNSIAKARATATDAEYLGSYNSSGGKASAPTAGCNFDSTNFSNNINTCIESNSTNKRSSNNNFKQEFTGFQTINSSPSCCHGDTGSGSGKTTFQNGGPPDFQMNVAATTNVDNTFNGTSTTATNHYKFPYLDKKNVSPARLSPPAGSDVKGTPDAVQYYNFLNNKEFFIDAVKCKDARLSFVRKQGPNLKSIIWTTFSVIYFEGEITNFVKCDRCDHVYKYDRRTTGTSTLNRHPCIRYIVLGAAAASANNGTDYQPVTYNTTGDNNDGGGDNGYFTLSDTISQNASANAMKADDNNGGEFTTSFSATSSSPSSEKSAVKLPPTGSVNVKSEFNGGLNYYYCQQDQDQANNNLPPSSNCLVVASSSPTASADLNNNSTNNTFSDNDNNIKFSRTSTGSTLSHDYRTLRNNMLYNAAQQMDLPPTMVPLNPNSQLYYSKGTPAGLIKNLSKSSTSKGESSLIYSAMHPHANANHKVNDFVGDFYHHGGRHHSNVNNWNSSITKPPHAYLGNYSHTTTTNPNNSCYEPPAERHPDLEDTEQREDSLAHVRGSPNPRSGGSFEDLPEKLTSSSFSTYPSALNAILNSSTPSSKPPFVVNMTYSAFNLKNSTPPTPSFTTLGGVKSHRHTMMTNGNGNDVTKYASCTVNHYPPFNNTSYDNNKIVKEEKEQEQDQSRADDSSMTNNDAKNLYTKYFNPTKSSLSFNQHMLNVTTGGGKTSVQKSRQQSNRHSFTTSSSSNHYLNGLASESNGSSLKEILQQENGYHEDEYAAMFWAKIGNVGLLDDFVNEIKLSLDEFKRTLLHEMGTIAANNLHQPYRGGNSLYHSSPTFSNYAKRLSNIVNELNLMSKFKYKLSQNQHEIQCAKEKIHREMNDLKRKLEMQELRQRELYKKSKYVDELIGLNYAPKLRRVNYNDKYKGTSAGKSSSPFSRLQPEMKSIPSTPTNRSLPNGSTNYMMPQQSSVIDNFKKKIFDNLIQNMSLQQGSSSSSSSANNNKDEEEVKGAAAAHALVNRDMCKKEFDGNENHQVDSGDWEPPLPPEGSGKHVIPKLKISLNRDGSGHLSSSITPPTQDDDNVAAHNNSERNNKDLTLNQLLFSTNNTTTTTVSSHPSSTPDDPSSSSNTSIQATGFNSKLANLYRRFMKTMNNHNNSVSCNPDDDDTELNELTMNSSHPHHDENDDGDVFSENLILIPQDEINTGGDTAVQSNHMDVETENVNEEPGILFPANPSPPDKEISKVTTENISLVIIPHEKLDTITTTQEGKKESLQSSDDPSNECFINSTYSSNTPCSGIGSSSAGSDENLFEETDLLNKEHSGLGVVGDVMEKVSLSITSNPPSLVDEMITC